MYKAQSSGGKMFSFHRSGSKKILQDHVLFVNGISFCGKINVTVYTIYNYSFLDYVDTMPVRQKKLNLISRLFSIVYMIPVLTRY